MASSTSKASSQKNISVALSTGTHSWRPTPETEAFQDDLVAILRERGITRLDTARSYVSTLDKPLLLAASIFSSHRMLISLKYLGNGCFGSRTGK
jgi:aryl-alcohol dehydrogenase-like predicted oxidoreductase